jgi:hypothetical protein
LPFVFVLRHGFFVAPLFSDFWKFLPKNGKAFRVQREAKMRKEIALIAGPRNWGETKEFWLGKVAPKVKTVSHRTVKALWYGEISDDDHWAARDIRRTAQIIEAQREAAELAGKLQSIVNGLEQTDPSFHGPTVAALVGTLRKLRGEDRS